MSYRPITTAGTLLTLLENIVTHTRPAVEAELVQSLNFGMGKVVRAIGSVRPQAFLSFVDPFTIAAGQAEYDLGAYTPAVSRPIRLTVPGGSNSGMSVVFRYRALMDPMYEAQDGRASGAVGAFFYDVLTGQFPQTPHAYVSYLLNVLTFASAAELVDFPIGASVLLPNAGAALSAGETGLTLNQDLFSTVIAQPSPTTIRIGNTPVVDAGGYGTIGTKAIVPLWRRMLRLAPTPATTYQGRLYYDAEPQRVVLRTEPLHNLVAKYQDCVIEYALSQLLKGTADTMHRDHLEAADALRAELMQDQEPLAGQNSEALSSGLGDD